MTTRTPPVVLGYGLLGLIPFLAPPFAPAAWHDPAARLLGFYGALILSFLGGARWGLVVARPAPSPKVVSLAMLPTLVGLALLLLPADLTRWRLLGLALALAVHWVWDLGSVGMPAWYPTLRSILTAGAVLGLVAGAFKLA